MLDRYLELWHFVNRHIQSGDNLMLLVVADSSGSSPGRQGYKMAVAADGELIGSIGGGVMEVSLVEQSRSALVAGSTTKLSEQVHRENAPNPSGMICSGKQTVIFKLLTPKDASAVDSIIETLKSGRHGSLVISPTDFSVRPDLRNMSRDPRSEIPDPRSDGDCTFEKLSDTEFVYTETLGFKNHLYIIGGGHCALALSELMSKMDFHISLFDDRPDLNTIEKNRFAHDIKIVDSYERIGDHIPSGRSAYVVVMTLGYKTDGIVIRSLINKEFKYFGVLGSKAKMSVMFNSLRNEGLPGDRLDAIRTPVGLPINSRTPEEIAVSIAAQIISVKNG